MATTEQSDGLKLISGWFKWLVAIQSAAIALIASLMKDKCAVDYAQHRCVKAALITAIFSFIGSIVVAVLVVSEVPTSITDIQPHEKVWNRGIYWFGGCLCSMWLAANIILVLFLIGIIAFAFSLVFLMAGH